MPTGRGCAGRCQGFREPRGASRGLCLNTTLENMRNTPAGCALSNLRFWGDVIPAPAGSQCEMSVAITLAACVRHSRAGGNDGVRGNDGVQWVVGRIFTTDCSDDTDGGIRLWMVVVHLFFLTTKDTKKRQREGGRQCFVKSWFLGYVIPACAGMTVNPNFKSVKPNFRL